MFLVPRASCLHHGALLGKVGFLSCLEELVHDIVGRELRDFHLLSSKLHQSVCVHSGACYNCGAKGQVGTATIIKECQLGTCMTLKSCRYNMVRGRRDRVRMRT